MKSRAPDADQLGELVNSVRAGDQDADDALRRLFYPGARFLIQRRLGTGHVKLQVTELLDFAVRTIREDAAVEGGNVAALVRQLIAQRFPATNKGSPQAIPKAGAVALAKGVLEHLSPVEQDALRRCYVLRQPPESILEALKLTPDQLRAIRSKARTEFSTRHPRQINVA